MSEGKIRRGKNPRRGKGERDGAMGIRERKRGKKDGGEMRGEEKKEEEGKRGRRKRGREEGGRGEERGIKAGFPSLRLLIREKRGEGKKGIKEGRKDGKKEGRQE